MQVYNGKKLVVDGNIDLLTIRFESDEELETHIKNLRNMHENFPKPGAKRLYMVYPPTLKGKETIIKHIRQQLTK